MKKLSVLILLLGIGLSLAQPFAARSIGVDFSQSNIAVDQILSGGPPPQGIPALGFLGDWQGAAGATRGPQFVSQEEAAAWLGENEPVIAFTAGGETRAYPLQILTWHEIVNDVVGGVPVAVTFCPLCNSALAFDRRIPLTEEAHQALIAVNPGAELQEAADIFDDAFLAAYDAQGGDVGSLVAGSEATFGVSGMLFNSNLLMFDTVSSTLWAQILGEG
ncbi:MAG: DUF3179 domain-containing protein, partial [Trueperaceae bacterium]